MDEYDVVIVGAGSGNMIPFDLGGRRIAIVERDRFGGTCLNRGCIPSKMLVYVADVAETIRTAGGYGVNAQLLGTDWPAVRDRIFARTDQVSDDGRQWRERNGVDVYTGVARFVAPKVLEVDGQELRAERMIVAAGSRPTIPEIPGLRDIPFHTTDTIMRIDALPASMIVIGGGYVAAEMCHILGAFGTQVTIVERESKLLGALDDEIALRFTEGYSERFDVRLSARVTKVEATAHGYAVHVDGGPRPGVVEAETILVATGRTPNSDVLDVEAGGIATDENGLVVTDDECATNLPGVWAIGDITNRIQLKHLANAQMRIAVHNAFHPESPRRSHFAVLPSAVFADPQVASVGSTERALREQGRAFDVARRNYSDTAFGWAARDTTGFVKLIADPATRLLLGAHIIGPDASTLIQPLVQAMSLGNTLDQLAREVLYIHPAATEVVAQALLEFPHPTAA